LDIIFSIAMLLLVLVFYFSNRHNKVNRWCAFAAFLYWLGIAKEAAMYSVLPMLEGLQGTEGLQEGFMPIYSFCTWALYTLAMPTSVVFSLYFYGLDKDRPKTLRRLQALVYGPALVLSVFFPPFVFRDYQLTSLSFWIAYASHNLLLCAVFVFVMIKAIRAERPGKEKNQKKWVTLVILPPVVFWALSIFVTHLFQIDGLFSVWKINIVVVLGGVVFLFYIAFHDGFMGMRLTGETYNWNTNMNLVNTGAEYTSHMIKTQTTKMELCIANLKARYAPPDNEEEPQELAILSRSLSALKGCMDRIRRHSQPVTLMREPCRVADLLGEAVSASTVNASAITITVDADENVIWSCDRNHMTEVFANLLTNAAEAIHKNGAVEITGTHGKSGYSLCFKDDGPGMDADTLHDMYTPYFTTKNTERNFGLGLAYCKNVVEKHGGTLSAKSSPGKGTAVTVYIPFKRVLPGGIGGRGNG